MRIERVQNWDQYAPLRRASAERAGGGQMRTEFNSLRMVSQEIPDPSAGEWKPRSVSLLKRMSGMMVLKAEL